MQSKTCTKLLQTTTKIKSRNCADLCRSHGIRKAALVPSPHLWRQLGVQCFRTQRHLLRTVCYIHRWPEPRGHQQVHVIAGSLSTHQVLRATHHLTHIYRPQCYTLHCGVKESLEENFGFMGGGGFSAGENGWNYCQSFKSFYWAWSLKSREGIYLVRAHLAEFSCSEGFGRLGGCWKAVLYLCVKQTHRHHQLILPAEIQKSSKTVFLLPRKPFIIIIQ